MGGSLWGRRWPRGLAALLMSASLFAVMVGGRTVSAREVVSASVRSTSIASAPVESGKVTFNETSIGGPSYWTNVPTGQPGAGARNLIAWTGTDPAHHVNVAEVLVTSSGVSLANKETLSETSIVRPSIAVQPSQLHAPYTFVAWTGTDPAHSLNIICDGCASSRVKLTLRESSLAAPAVATLGATLMLAWTGNDSRHSLNALGLSVSNGHFVIGRKQTLTAFSASFSSNSGPSLTYNPDTSDVGAQNVLLSWSDRATGRIKVAASVNDPTNWPAAGWFTYSETSAATPSMLGLVPTVNISRTYLAWTGSDPAHSLNLLYPAYLPRLDSTKATLHESALGGPALGYSGGNRLGLVWTGTDPAHHLNFATITV